MKIELGTKLTCTFNYLLLKPQSGGKVLHYKHYKNYKNNPVKFVFKKGSCEFTVIKFPQTNTFFIIYMMMIIIIIINCYKLICKYIIM